MPAPLTLRDALARSAPLGSLLRRAEASRARLQAVRAALPAGLAAGLDAAAPDEDGRWTLLAPHPAAAAKLRQWLPTLAQQLAAAGFEGSLTVKVRGSR